LPAASWRCQTSAIVGVTPVEASTTGLTGTRTPDSTQARWLGAKRGASSPPLISRVTAKRLKAVGGRQRRELSAKPSVGVSISPCAAVMMPSSCGGSGFLDSG
jgi:hypothetical protein